MRFTSIPVSLLAVGFAGLAWVAAPALSLRPYIPAARDFEQSLPDLERRAGTRVSPVVEAPHEFDLVGIGGEEREIELRARRDGEWSPWVETLASDPVYTGGADAVQVRTPGFEPRGELHYVNVSGTASGGPERLLDGARGAINEGFASVASSPIAGLLGVGEVEAAGPPQPSYVTRAGWGADNASGGCAPRSGPAYGAVQAAVVHHTVSTVDYAPAEAPALVLGICRFHVNGNGWNDIGYNALVDRFGTLYEGRAGGLGSAVVGAHTEGYNSQTTGIASIGDHTTVPLTPEAQSTLVSFLAWKLSAAGAVPATGSTTLLSAGGGTNRFPSGSPVTVPRIFGHGTTNATACPGATLAPLIATIAGQVQALIDRYGGQRRKKLVKCKRLKSKKKRRICRKRNKKRRQAR